MHVHWLNDGTNFVALNPLRIHGPSNSDHLRCMHALRFGMPFVSKFI